jgi:hypothetical protein
VQARLIVAVVATTLAVAGCASSARPTMSPGGTASSTSTTPLPSAAVPTGSASASASAAQSPADAFVTLTHSPGFTIAGTIAGAFDLGGGVAGPVYGRFSIRSGGQYLLRADELPARSPSLYEMTVNGPTGESRIDTGQWSKPFAVALDQPTTIGGFLRAATDLRDTGLANLAGCSGCRVLSVGGPALNPGVFGYATGDGGAFRVEITVTPTGAPEAMQVTGSVINATVTFDPLVLQIPPAGWTVYRSKLGGYLIAMPPDANTVLYPDGSLTSAVNLPLVGGTPGMETGHVLVNVTKNANQTLQQWIDGGTAYYRKLWNTAPLNVDGFRVGLKAIPAAISTWTISDCAGAQSVGLLGSLCQAVQTQLPAGSPPGVRLFDALMVRGADGIDVQFFTRASSSPLDRLQLDQYLAGFHF